MDDHSDNLPDLDPDETQEWIDSLDGVIDVEGPQRARYLMAKLLERSQDRDIGVATTTKTPYINTIPPEAEPAYPGDEKLERRIRRYIRWNAAAMVIKANHEADGIGGHLSTYASSSLLYEMGFNHFFRGKADGRSGDALYIQGHASPGIYARSYVERRFDEPQLDGFRREVSKGGVSSYPHPRLMPDYWEYPTVSMGLGPINSIYHARFNRYLLNRGIDDTTDTRVWCFIGDGETDEPETLGSISLAGREKLDNLTWVVNCNLQRLDGPVRGNGKIIQELEAMFRGAGWNVIKVVWGRGWDALLDADTEGVLVDKMNRSVDGEYQRYKAEDGAYVREHFFGPDPRLRELAAHLSDDEIWALRRGGLDSTKVHAAYKAATEHEGTPTVILAKTIKGWTLGDLEGINSTHSVKKLSKDQLIEFRDRLQLDDEISDADLEDGDPPYLRPSIDSPEYRYLTERRAALNGPLPSRATDIRSPLPTPGREPFDEVFAGSGNIEASTTMAFTRLMRGLTRDEGIGSRVVPIIPDEGRTFGWDALFKELGIYAAHGQKYEPVDAKLLLSYREAQDGQILEEGITEAGAMASWIAAATNYVTRGIPMVPFYIFYSMFGFQRVGDLIWSAADAGARGFLLGATAGRTTMLGEGLQHQDGHSHVLASVVPVCQAYDPAFAYELGVIIDDGMRRMYRDGEDIFYYLTIYNENYQQPAKPGDVDEGITSGLYRCADPVDGTEEQAKILFSGPAHAAARQAQTDLAEHYGIGASLWSATSYKLLRENALEVERWNRLHPAATPRVPRVTRLLADTPGPTVAVTDYMKIVPDQVARWVPGDFTPLGTDGFGRSDTREALRGFFEVNAGHVVVATLASLARAGAIGPEVVSAAIARYGIDPDTADPRYR